MHANHSETRPSAHTSRSKPNEYWEFIKNLMAIGLVIFIAYILLTAGGVL